MSGTRPAPAPLPPPAPSVDPAGAPLPPRARGRWPGEYLVALAREPLATFVGLARAHGDVVRFRSAGRTFVLVATPELAREVLVTQQRRFVRGYAHRGLALLLGQGLLTSEGELHRRQRRLAQPAFHRERIARYAVAMVDAAARWDARWDARWTARREAPARGAAGAPPVDMAAEMMALTLAIVGDTLFGADVGPATADVSAAITDALRAGPLAFLPLGRWALELPIPVARRFRAARARLDAVVAGLVAGRRGVGGAVEDRGDLLSMLLLATDPDEGDGQPMSDRQLRDEVLTIFIAGHETTANALSWTWYLLAGHPAAAARLHAELDAVLGPGDAARLPTPDDLPRLPYARAVIAESMRLFPPAYAVGRICAERTTLGGWRIEPGWGVITSPWLAHHDPRWWPEPEAFRPERWLRDGDAEDPARPRFAYFPFGGGTRICIGEQFAWTETTLVLATLARRWAPRLAPGTAVRPHGAITLRPAGGLPMTLDRR